MFQRNGSLLPKSRRQRFHIGMILIVSFDEQHRARVHRFRPLDVVPIFCMPLRLGKEFRCSGPSDWVQLGIPALQAGLLLLWIEVDLA